MPKILIVEDSPVQSRLLVGVLEADGFETETVDTLARGIEAASTEPLPDLVITDRLLPDGSGLKLCRELRRRQLARRVPVIIHTSQGTATDLLEGIEAGADGYMVKDLPPQEMLDRIQQVLAASAKISQDTSDGHERIDVRFLNREYQLTASREQLVSVVVSALEDLARASERHEAELARRRNAEQKLRDSEALYESLVENLPMNLFRKDRDGRVTYANQRYCESLGRSVETLLGRTDFDLFPRDLADKYTADDRRIMEDGVTFEDTESHVTPEGELRYVHVLKSPVHDADGNVVGIQGIFWDVTARTVAEQSLDRERFLLNSLLDSIPDNIFFKDLEGRYIRVNPAMAHRLGLEDPDEASGKLSREFFKPEYAERIEASDRRLVEVGDSVIGEEQLVDWPDGTRKWVSVTRMPLHGPSGRIEGTFGLSHDITDQKLAQETMKRARDAAEAASEAKSNFLANMSHEIRTPMNAIIGMTELVLDTELTASQHEYLTMVQESGEALLGVINDILDFSKIEAGRLELDPRPFALRETIGDTLKSLAIRTHGRDVEVACHIGPDVEEFLVGDAGRVRQVLINLVGNAIKFTEFGEVVVDIAVAEEAVLQAPLPGGFIPDSPVKLHFRVKDTGIGIPEDKLHQIFDAFEQADTSMTRRYEGTGLGLAISSRLVEMMGGHIWVESTVGEGSTFHFTAAFGRAPESIATQPRSTASLEGRRVLVVDDNATNRRILDEMLRNWLTQPTVVASAQEATVAIEEAHNQGQGFDLVLTDANMPEVDGFTLIEQIRSRSDVNAPVIMMLTSSGRMGDIARCSELNVASYLMKPIKQSELFDAIVAALGVSTAVDDEPEVTVRTQRHSRTLQVLLAEDSVVNQKLAIALLEKWGHHVTVANNGREAVETSTEAGFDVILMDVQMPEMDGLQATEQIRKREAGTAQHTPIVAMTAHAMKGDEERCLAVGMDAYISKPIRAPLLFQKLSELCNADGDDSETPTEAHTGAAQRSSVVDWDEALQTVAGDRGLLLEVLAALLIECPSQLELLDGAVHNRDAPTARRAAHTILGNFRMLSATGPMDTAHEVELLARDGKFDEIEEPRRRLRAAVDDVLNDVRAYLDHQR
ncbi:MAG: response regulator [Planctomycetota bacterium]|jgi:PAS domain S-box-containing protein